jgi:hypothetical protein
MTIWNIEVNNPDPRTITAGVGEFLIQQAPTDIIFDTAIFPEIYNKNVDITYPADSVIIPAKATWQARIEIEWKKEEFDLGSFDGYAEALMRIDDTKAWPYGLERGSTKASFVPKTRGRSRARRITITLPPLLLFKDEAIKISISQDSDRPRLLSYAVLSLTLFEPARGFLPWTRSPL